MKEYTPEERFNLMHTTRMDESEMIEPRPNASFPISLSMSKILTPRQIDEVKARYAKQLQEYIADNVDNSLADIPALLADREERDRLLLLAGHYSRVCACESCVRVRAAIGEPTNLREGE